MELYGFMEREKKIPSYFFIITKGYKSHKNNISSYSQETTNYLGESKIII